MVANVTREQIDQWKYKLTHGFPVSVNDQRLLFEVAFGTKIGAKNRCNECYAEGCSACSFEGFV